MFKNTLIIGIGGGGINIIRDLINRNNIYADYCAIDNDKVSVNNSFANYKNCIEESNNDKRNAKMVLYDFRNIEYNLKAQMSLYDKIYVISCLGGIFASIKNVCMAKLNKDQGLRILKLL